MTWIDYAKHNFTWPDWVYEKQTLFLQHSQRFCIGSKYISWIALLYLPFKKSKNSFKYLGVPICHKLSDLYKNNFPPLVDKLKSDLERWNNLHITIAGRVNCIKINVLPHFLHLFQCLPIFLPNFSYKQTNFIFYMERQDSQDKERVFTKAYVHWWIITQALLQDFYLSLSVYKT